MNPKHRRKRPIRQNKKGKRRPPPRGSASSPRGAPGQTFQEARYLKHLASRRLPVVVRTWSDEEYTGVVEYYDKSFIRLTCSEGPNLFLFKSDIKYLSEQPTTN